MESTLVGSHGGLKVHVIARCADDAKAALEVSPRGRLIHYVPEELARKDGNVISVEIGAERYGLNWEEFDQLLGRLLTLCDATFTDPVQRKAFKDQVKHHVKEWVSDVIMEAARDAGLDRKVSAPFVGGILGQLAGEGASG